MEWTDVLRLAKKIPNFRGVYPVDRLPIPSKVPAVFIVNTITSDSRVRMGHWIAIVVTDLFVYVMDSIGHHTKRNRYLINYLRKIGKPLITNPYDLQPPQSIYCGIHCLIFLYKYVTLKTTFTDFIRDVKQLENSDQYVCSKF